MTRERRKSVELLRSKLKSNRPKVEVVYVPGRGWIASVDDSSAKITVASNYRNTRLEALRELKIMVTRNSRVPDKSVAAVHSKYGAEKRKLLTD